MLSKKKKIIILVVMVALLVVTGYLNIALNNNVATATSTNAASDFYAGYRADRQAARDEAISKYDAIIASAESSEQAKAEAAESRQKLIESMEKELVIEGLIKGFGYEDAIITTSSEYYNVVVKASELDQIASNKIARVVSEQLGGISLDYIKVMNSL